MSGQSRALPRQFYGNPADCVGKLRKVIKAGSETEALMAERHRLRKGRRIRALVRNVMKNGGGR